jgi:methyltransferase
MTNSLFTLSVIAGMMLAEARLSASNERALRARGARAPSEPQYPVMAVLYPLSFIAMAAEGAWRGAGVSPWLASGALMFAASKALKYWAIGSLGERWTFRVLVLPGAPLVQGGPYRYVAHPNYIAVVGELAGMAMMMHALVSGPVALTLFGFVLWRRVRFETEAIRDAIR